jgi:hypothetical protein
MAQRWPAPNVKPKLKQVDRVIFLQLGCSARHAEPRGRGTTVHAANLCKTAVPVTPCTLQEEFDDAVRPEFVLGVLAPAAGKRSELDLTAR